MLKAKDNNDKYIDINDAIRGDIYHCIACGGDVLAKKGLIKQYFSHLIGDNDECEEKVKAMMEERDRQLALERERKRKEKMEKLKKEIKEEPPKLSIEEEIKLESGFNEGQAKAYDMIFEFLKNKNKQMFVLSGIGGSGKSFLISKIIKVLERKNKNFSVATFTGKATAVLIDRGGYHLKHYIV